MFRQRECLGHAFSFNRALSANMHDIDAVSRFFVRLTFDIDILVKVNGMERIQRGEISIALFK